MKKKQMTHFSVEDIIKNEFKKPLSRGTIGKDTHGLLWAYGILLRDSLFWVQVITIDLETHKVERIKDKERSCERRDDANAYIKGLIKEIILINSDASNIDMP